jgi:1-acyl-sn-glycerol-3-phosphate acyltransferase
MVGGVPAYAFLRSLIRVMLWMFFRQIEVVGREHVPRRGEGPVIFAGNHPNSLIDPAMIVATCGRVVHFAAKDVLFRSRFLRPILAGLGAVPIARRKDHAGKSLDNRQAFAAMVDVLAEGHAIGIFPEGVSHDDAHLQRLKTGAARLALQTSREHPGLGLKIIPVGLTYMHRKRFRSRVLVQFGAPVVVGDCEVEEGSDAERDAARAMTDELELRLRGLTINASDWTTLRVLDGVRRLYQPTHIPLEQRVELGRRFATVYEQVKDEPKIKALYWRVAVYLDRLRASGLQDRDLSGHRSAATLLWRSVSQLVLLTVWLPLALPGALLLAPLALVVGWAGVSLAPRKDVIGTTKLVAGTLAVLAVQGTLFALLGVRYGWQWGVAAALLLLLSGYGCVKVFDRFGSLTRVSLRALRSLLLGERIADLIAERKALVAAVEAAVEQFIPSDMERLFPPPSARQPTTAGADTG